MEGDTQFSDASPVHTENEMRLIGGRSLGPGNNIAGRIASGANAVPLQPAMKRKYKKNRDADRGLRQSSEGTVRQGGVLLPSAEGASVRHKGRRAGGGSRPGVEHREHVGPVEVQIGRDSKAVARSQAASSFRLLVSPRSGSGSCRTDVTSGTTQPSRGTSRGSKRSSAATAGGGGEAPVADHGSRRVLERLRREYLKLHAGLPLLARIMARSRITAGLARGLDLRREDNWAIHESTRQAASVALGIPSESQLEVLAPTAAARRAMRSRARASPGGGVASQRGFAAAGALNAGAGGNGGGYQ